MICSRLWYNATTEVQKLMAHFHLLVCVQVAGGSSVNLSESEVTVNYHSTDLSVRLIFNCMLEELFSESQ